MNQEIMALYKQEGVNPLNPGCLPMFLQMPVFIALFVVLRKAIELRGAATVLVPWITICRNRNRFFHLGTYADTIIWIKFRSIADYNGNS